MPKISQLPEFGTPEPGAIIPASKAGMTATVKLSAYQIGDLATNWGLSGDWQSAYTNQNYNSAAWGGGSSKWTQSGQNIYPIPTGDVGIGETSPAKKLHIVTGDASDGIRIGYNATNFADLWVEADGSWGVNSTGTTPALDFRTVSQSRMYVDAAGNVGIGTTSPGLPLDVRNGDGERVMRLVSKTANDCQMEMWSNNGASADSGWGFESANVGQFRIAESTATLAASNSNTWTTRLVINEGGNVGIGTAAPTQVLHVEGRALLVSDCAALGNAQLHIEGNTSSANHLYLGYDTTSNYGFIQSVTDGIGYRDFIINANGGNVGIGTAAPSAELEILQPAGNSPELKLTSGTVYTKIIADDASGFSAIDYSHDLRFKDAGTETMRIDSSGNCGIGCAPSQKLHVYGAGADVLLENSAAGALNYKIKTSTGSAVKREWHVGADDSPDQFHIRDDTNSANRLVINSTGNVGIGTTAPARTLHVAGDIQYDGHIIGDDPGGYIQFDGPSSATAWVIGSTGGNASPATAATSLGFHRWNGSAWANPITVTSAGDVKLGGGLDLGGKLDVGERSGGTADINIGIDSDNRAIFTWTNSDKRLSIGTRNAGTGYHDAFNLVNGKVGIGTTSPGSLFHLSDRAADVSIKFLANETTTSITTNSEIIASSPTGTGGQLGFYTKPNGAAMSSTPDLTILESGKVGIGTAEPFKRLEVNASTGGGVSFAHGSTNPDGLSTNSDRDIVQIGGGYGTGSTAGQFALHSMHDGGSTYDGGLQFLGQYYDGSAYTWKERMRIDSVGHIGIGTTSPAAVVDATTPTLNLNGTSTSTSGGIIFKVNGTNKGYQYVQNDYFNHAGAANIGHLFLTNGSTQAMRILATGEVGIGTVPDGSTILHAKRAGESDAYLKTTSVDGEAGLSFETEWSGAVWNLFLDGKDKATGMANASDAGLYSSTGGTIMKFQSGGQVSIGAPPGTQLVSKLTLQTPSVTDPVLRMVDSGVANYDWTFPTADIVRFQTNTTGSKVLDIVNQGAGFFNFSVHGVGAFGRGAAASINDGTETGYVLSIDDSIDAKMVLRNSDNPYIRFQEGTADRGYVQWHKDKEAMSIVNQAHDTSLYLADNGLGVNNSVPTEALDVTGNIKASGSVYSTTTAKAWATYNSGDSSNSYSLQGHNVTSISYVSTGKTTVNITSGVITDVSKTAATGCVVAMWGIYNGALTDPHLDIYGGGDSIGDFGAMVMTTTTCKVKTQNNDNNEVRDFRNVQVIIFGA